MPGGAPQKESRPHDDDLRSATITRTPARTSSASSSTRRSPQRRPTTPPTGTRAASPTDGPCWPWPPSPAGPAGALGAEAGVTLTSGPGIVVQRELAAAARLLDEATEAADGEPEEIADHLVPAQRLFSQLRRLTSPDGRVRQRAARR